MNFFSLIQHLRLGEAYGVKKKCVVYHVLCMVCTHVLLLLLGIEQKKNEIECIVR